MKKKFKEEFVDDGRTIANMNVEGTPWYNPVKPEKSTEPLGEVASVKETFAIIKGVLGAALLVGLIISGVFALLILFLCFIWK